MIQKVLCAVDDSEHSRIAVGFAGRLAKASGAELTLLAVNTMMGSPAIGTAIYVWEDADVERILNDAAALARTTGISDPRKVSVKSRDAGRAIALYAEDNGIDHIVVGTGGKGSLSRMRLGSVSRDVVARAHCSVTVAR